MPFMGGPRPHLPRAGPSGCRLAQSGRQSRLLRPGDWHTV